MSKSKAKQVKGKIKETTGNAVDDGSMQAEGRGEQIKGKIQETTEKTGERVRKSHGR
jgi:uncharacterized protein YjbJ (UPF0337 family)